MAAAQDYNWNIPCRLYIAHPISENRNYGPTTPDSVDQYIAIDHEKPTAPTDIAKFIADHGLNHGDLVDFGNYRQSGVVIVCRDVAGGMTWVKNPDDHRAGYLTIPARALENVTDAMAKYKDIMEYMEEENQSYNMHLSHKDKLIREKFGDVPEGYIFIIYGFWPDNVEFFFVERLEPDKEESEKEEKEEWEEEDEEEGGLHGEFDWNTVTWQQVLDKFAELDAEQESDSI